MDESVTRRSSARIPKAAGDEPGITKEDSLSADEPENDDLTQDGLNNKSKNKRTPSKKVSVSELPGSTSPPKVIPRNSESKYRFNNNDDGELDYTDPAYADKNWFKNNCLQCQVCKSCYTNTVDALNCFSKHDDYLRCYICFTVIEGGKEGTKNLFRHYVRRHKGDQEGTAQCPYCMEYMAYRCVSCHIVSIHFRDALEIPATGAAVPVIAASPVRATKKPKRSRLTNGTRNEADGQEETEANLDKEC